MRAGVELFLAGIVSVMQHPLVALRVCWLPYLLGLATYVAFEQTGDPDGLSAFAVGVAVDALAVALVAVGWHRFCLLGQLPSVLGVTAAPGRFLHYAIEWVVLGVVVGLSILAFSAPVWALGYVLGDGRIMGLLDEAQSGYFSFGSVVFFTVVSWLFTWGFFRLALNLPHLAIRADRGPRLASWARTSALEPAVLFCALFAALGYVLLLAPVNWAYDLLPYDFIFVDPEPGPGETYRFSLRYFALSQFGWTLITLFGASILTEIYRRTTP